jgi:integrase/recombinase XerD
MQLEDGKAPLTLQGYRYGLRPFFRWLGDRDPLSVTLEAVQEHLAGVWRQFENPHTRFSRVKVLKVFYGWLARKGLVSEDPTKGIIVPRLPDEVPYVLTVAEVDALRRACAPNTFEGLRNRTMLEVAFDCGLRSVELRRVLVSNIDWKERILLVHGKARPGRPAPVRSVPFSQVVTRTLRKYLAARSSLPGDSLFVDKKGLPITRRNMCQVIERLRAKACLKTARGSWHDLRHAFTTEMLRNGANEEHLRRMLGHKDRRMLARYSHLVTADLVRHHDQHSPADRLLRE